MNGGGRGGPAAGEGVNGGAGAGQLVFAPGGAVAGVRGESAAEAADDEEDMVGGGERFEGLNYFVMGKEGVVGAVGEVEEAEGVGAGLRIGFAAAQPGGQLGEGGEVAGVGEGCFKGEAELVEQERVAAGPIGKEGKEALPAGAQFAGGEIRNPAGGR